MSINNPLDWHAVALAKLTNVLGEKTAHVLATSILGELGIPKISSAAELRRFADALIKTGGFAAAVGGLLTVHVTMFEPKSRDA